MRTTPAGIVALRGVATTREPVWLVKLELSSGTIYYSSGSAVSYGGNSYVANRIHSINSFEIAYIDRKINNALGLEVEIDNLADNGSAVFPVTALNAAVSFEDAKITVYCYSPDASDAVLMLWGHIGGVKFSGNEKYATISGSFFWDALDSPSPSLTLEAKGFASQEVSAKASEIEQDNARPVPLIYGTGAMRVRPVIYNHYVSQDGAYFNVQFCMSGIHSGFPFGASDIVASGLKLFGGTPASVVEFYPGNQVTAPANLTRFPENNAHTLCAFGFASYAITNEIKDRLDDEIYIRGVIQNGRPLVDTGIPSENGPLIVRDLLRDPVFGVGLASGAFDTTVLTSTANYVGTRYQLRYEMREQVPIAETVQRILADFHGFITFDGGLIQIRCKKNTETSVATFATVDSGQAGRKIHDDYVDVIIKDSSELINQVTIKYRRKLRNRRIVTLYDPNAQIRAGGTAKKVVEDTIDEWEMGGVYDETQAQILAAITVREEQNGNLFINFDVPIWDGLDVSPGDVITVHSPDIINNGTNNTFRVTKQSIDSSGDYLIHFECQVYKQAIYNDDAVALGVDLLRGGDDTNAQGRAPDVTPVSLTVVNVGEANDTGSKMATIRAVWTYPTVDETTNIAEGVYREYPIAEVDLMWHYTDESINQARRGANVKHPTTQADFQIDYDKSRSIECFFVAVGHNRARAPLGYIPDPTKVTSIVGTMSSTAAAQFVANSGAFAVNDYAIIEKEVVRIAVVVAGQLNFVPNSPPRATFFDSVSIAHPAGTEIAVAKLSYPSLTRSLAVPRFTYPTVTLTDILQRGGDGVRVRWTDINPDNLESYLVYYSMDADAGSNVNKLGSTTPAWYLTDPRTPGSGVNLIWATKQRTVLIPQESIGPVGTAVRVRVAAKNGKQNFSAALSNLGNSSVAAPGTTSPPTDPPSMPVLGSIVENTYEITPEGLQARIKIGLFADPSGTKTFAQTGTTSIVFVFQRTDGSKIRLEVPVEDLTATSITVVLYLPFGEQLTWIKNIALNAGGRNESTGSATFFAGGSTTSLTGISGLAISSITGIDEKHSYLAFGYTQPATPALVSHAIIFRKLAGEGGFTKEHKISLLSEAGNQTAGAKTFTEVVKHPRKNAVQWKIRLVSVDGTTLESAVFNNTSPDADTGPPNNGTAITINRAFLKKGAKLIVDFVLPTVQMASHSKNVLIIHDNNFTGAGRRFFDPLTSAWVTTYPDGSTELSFAKGGIPSLPITPAEIFIAGRTTFYIRVGVYNLFNGSSVTYSGDLTTPITLAGSGADDALGDTGVPTSLAAPDVQDQFGTLEVSCPRPSANSATIKRYQVILSTQSTAPAGAPTLNLEGVQKIKYGQGVDFRNKQGSTVTIYFYFRCENDYGFSGWSPGTSVTGTTIGRPADDVIGTGVPALAMALERNTTSGSGHGLSTFVLDAGANQTLNYYAGMVLHVPSLAAVDKVRNIIASIFSGGVVTVTIDTSFSGVPGNSIVFEVHYGLTLAGKTGSGHTTTAIVLPSSASSVNDFYNGMMLYIPSAAVGEQLQRIISYVGSTRTATVELIEAALTAAPANNCGFMLSSGSFGYAVSNGTGVIAPVPHRLWYNDESVMNVGEVILPTGQNAYSLSDFQIQAVRKSNQVIRSDQKIAITSSGVFQFPAKGYTPLVRVRFRNAYRGGGASDGWGPWSYYVPGFLSTAPPTTAYKPGTYVPIEVDPEAFANLPSGKYVTF